MNRRFLHYYERELRHLRELGGEFAAEHPKVAARLGLESFECADPYVERLIESTAFMAARVQFKLDAEFPRFTQNLLETIYPDYLAPTPSMAVVQFHPRADEGSLATGYPLPRQTILRSVLGKDEQTPCEYRTAHDVTLWPIELVEAAYHTQDLGALGLPAAPPTPAGAAVPTKAAVRLRLRCTLPGLTFAKLPMDRLTLYLRGVEGEHLRLYEQLLGGAAGVVVRPAVKPYGEQVARPGAGVRRVGFDEDQALLPPSPRTFEGYRLLREYFAFPARFLFVELAGLARDLARCDRAEVDVFVLLRSMDLALESVVSAQNFLPFCTPAINLFPKVAERVQLSDRFAEHQVLADRVRQLDYEVYQVSSVTGYGAGNTQETEFRPFYAARDADAPGGGGAYFGTNRVARALSERERIKGPRSSYTGSEVYLSLVDARGAPYSSELRQLAMRTLCTNRDLPLRMPLGQGTTDFHVDGGPPVRAARCVGSPTPPKPSFAEGEFAWRVVSHLSLNYLSLADTNPATGAAALRDLLGLYVELATDSQQAAATAALARQVEGLKSVTAAPVVRRAPGPGPVSLLRGLEVTVTFDENAFAGTGAFVLGAVLEAFFSRYVSLNSFTETVIKTLDREEIMRWPSRLGRKPTL